MRKSIWTVLLTALVALVAVGCAKEADLSDLKNKVTDLDKRVTALEDAVAKINNVTIPGFESLVNAVQNKISIVSVVEGDGEYTINFSDGTSATIKNGKDGNDGEDGNDAVAPEVSITLGEDGIYYWTVNGQLLKDEAGNPLPVTAKGDKGDQGIQGDKGDKGDKGDDGITPLFGTSSEGKVIVSYDGGETWKPLGFSVIDGSAFTSAYIDDNKSTEDYIVLVVGETEVQIPKEKTFSLKITYDGNLNSVGINAGETIALEYAVQGVSSTDEVTVDILSATAGITAKIAAVDAVSGYIMISVPAADPEATEPAKIEGKIFVFADNNKGKSNIKVISLEKGEIAAVADVSAQAPAAGGEFELTVTTNKEYNVNINDEAASWLSVVETKATHTDKLKIVAAKNETGAYRVGTVTINDRNTADKIAEYTVVQQPSADAPFEAASLSELPDDAAVTAKNLIVVAASKEGLLVVDEFGSTAYVAAAGNVAIERGEIISFEGVKKTNEATGYAYVEAKSVVDGEEPAATIPDLPWYYFGYSENFEATNTYTTAMIQKDDEGYFFVAPLGYTVKIESPMEALSIDSFVGKYAIVKGYVKDAVVVDIDWDTFEFIMEYKMMVNSIEEVTFAENANWKPAYEGASDDEDYPELISNTVSAGDDHYMLTVVSEETVQASAVSTTPGIYGAIKASDDLQYFFTRYASAYTPEQIYDLITYSESESESFAELAPGFYYAVAAGIDKNGLPTGSYAATKFEKKDPHVALDYDGFIGTWVIDNKKWVIEENEKDKSYKVYTDVIPQLQGIALNGAYLDGKFAFMETAIGQVGTYTDLVLSGESYSYSDDFFGLKVNYEDPQPIFIVSALNDGSFELIPGTVECNEKSYTFNYMELWDNTAAGFKDVKYAAVPKTIKPYVPSTATYDDFIGTFSFQTSNGQQSGTMTWAISENEKGVSYYIEGVPGPVQAKIVALYDSEQHAFVLKEQNVEGTYNHSTYGEVTDFIFGAQFSANGKDYWSWPANNDEPDVIFTMSLEEGTYSVTAGSFDGLTYKFGYHGKLHGQYDGYELSFATYTIPSVMTKSGSTPAINSVSAPKTSSCKVEKNSVFKQPKVGSVVVAGDKTSAKSAMEGRKINRKALVK